MAGDTPMVRLSDRVADFVRDYEFRGEPDYSPSDNERALIEDAIHGFISEAPLLDPALVRDWIERVGDGSMSSDDALAALSASPAREGDLGSSASPIPAEGPEAAVLVPVKPDLKWLRAQAESLSSDKDPDAVGALAWNLSVYHRRLTALSAPSTTSTAEQEEPTDYERTGDRSLWNPAVDDGPDPNAPGEGDAPVAWQKPEVEQDDGEICVRAFSADNQRAISFTVKRDKVIVCESALGESPTGETFEHSQFDTRPTPATPEGLREALEAMHALAEALDMYSKHGGNLISQKSAGLAATDLRKLLAALQPQAGEGE